MPFLLIRRLQSRGHECDALRGPLATVTSVFLPSTIGSFSSSVTEPPEFSTEIEPLREGVSIVIKPVPANVYNGADYIMYVDGVERKQVTVGSQSLNYTGYTSALWIGGNTTKSPTRNWDGLIDDVALFNQALTPAEIAAVKSGNFASFTNPLPPPSSTEWSTSGFGLWSSTTNWTPITLPSTATTADFGNTTNNPTTIVANTPDTHFTDVMEDADGSLLVIVLARLNFPNVDRRNGRPLRPCLQWEVLPDRCAF
jgi:hypothetical protein